MTIDNCTGCGDCCRSGPCLVGIFYYGFDLSAPACPGLYFERGRFWCLHNVTRTTFKLLGLISNDDVCVNKKGEMLRQCVQKISVEARKR